MDFAAAELRSTRDSTVGGRRGGQASLDQLCYSSWALLSQLARLLWVWGLQERGVRTQSRACGAAQSPFIGQSEPCGEDGRPVLYPRCLDLATAVLVGDCMPEFKLVAAFGRPRGVLSAPSCAGKPGCSRSHSSHAHSR